MDNVVTVKRSFLDEIRGLMNALSSLCVNCFRGTCDCALSNEIARAKYFMRELDDLRDVEKINYYIENPMEELCDTIKQFILQGGGKPIPSSEIKINGVYRQKKIRALKLLVKRGIIKRIDVGNKPFYAPLNKEVK